MGASTVDEVILMYIRMELLSLKFMLDCWFP